MLARMFMSPSTKKKTEDHAYCLARKKAKQCEGQCLDACYMHLSATIHFNRKERDKGGASIWLNST